MIRYPVYIPSKGRSARPLTIRALGADDVPFFVVVEPSEEALYRGVAGDRVLVLPFSDLGQGSIPARNWIRDHAVAHGHARHWQLDDNIACFYRLWERRRIPCDAGVALRVVEDLTDRYENVGVSGLNYDMFVNPNGGSGVSEPFTRNCHVYSATLVSHAMPYRWRGRYNEDTDLCLQSLVNGWATLLVNAFSVKKVTTMTMGGGNTDELYRDETGGGRDTLGRFEMARSLERAWPGLVRIARNYGRFQHSVNWSAFANDPPLRLRPDVDLGALPDVDEYGLGLRAVREVKSPAVREILEGYPGHLAELSAVGDHWRGLPGFRPSPPPLKMTVSFRSEEDRERLVDRLGVVVDKRFRDKGWSAWYPRRDREDPASLRFRRVL